MNKNVSFCWAILILILSSFTVVNLDIPDEENIIQTLFAEDGRIHASSNTFYLSEDIFLSANTTILEIGEVNSTSYNDIKGFGFEVEWNQLVGAIWITVGLQFTVPDGINISEYVANVTFYVDLFHNSTFSWQLDIPSTPLEETQTTLPDYWRSGTGHGNETLVVNTLVQGDDKFEIAVIDGQIHAQFAMIVVPSIGDFSRVLITFGKIDIWKIS